MKKTISAGVFRYDEECDDWYLEMGKRGQLKRYMTAKINRFIDKKVEVISVADELTIRTVDKEGTDGDNRSGG